MTFVITCYDLPADMLRECVTAIFSLAFQPGEREVIVIDDGSKLPAITDIDDVKDQIIYLRQPNSGLACARNMGIRVATSSLSMATTIFCVFPTSIASTSCVIITPTWSCSTSPPAPR